MVILWNRVLGRPRDRTRLKIPPFCLAKEILIIKDYKTHNIIYTSSPWCVIDDKSPELRKNVYTSLPNKWLIRASLVLNMCGGYPVKCGGNSVNHFRGGSRIFWVGGSKKRRINTGKSRHTLGGGGGPKGGRSMWKKNGNQIMLRCLLKHYKISIFQVYFCTLDFELHPPWAIFLSPL